MSARDPLAALLTGGPCPEWCERASEGHPYRFGLDDSDPEVYHRLHRKRLADLLSGQARLDLNQTETTSDPYRGSTLAATEVALSLSSEADGCVSIPDAEALISLITSLQAAAEQLRQATNPSSNPGVQ
jgi:hypothetical protein